MKLQKEERKWYSFAETPGVLLDRMITKIFIRFFHPSPWILRNRNNEGVFQVVIDSKEKHYFCHKVWDYCEGERRKIV